MSKRKWTVDEYEKLLKKNRKLQKDLEKLKTADQSTFQDDFDEDFEEEDSEGLSSSDSEVEIQSEEIGRSLEDLESTPSKESCMINKDTVEPLDSFLQSALGVDPSKSLAKKVSIHPELLSHCKFYVTTGMNKELREKLVAKYDVPLDFATPLLNEQLKVNLSDKAQRRDNYRLETQRSISTALTALTSTLTMVNNVDENGVDLKDFVERLTDACKIMADTQFQLNEGRRAYIVPRFSKTLQETLRNSKPDKFLFGSDLAAKVKETKDADKLFEGNSASKTSKNQGFIRGSGNFRRPLGIRGLPIRAGYTASRGRGRQRLFFKGLSHPKEHPQQMQSLVYKEKKPQKD